MNKESSEAIDFIFVMSLAVYRNELSRSLAIENTFNKYGTSKGSCDMYIGIIRNMLDGKPYKRQMSSTATDSLLRNISSELGENYLRNALTALDGHIHHYEKQNKTKMNKLRAVYDKWSSS